MLAVEEEGNDDVTLHLLNTTAAPLTSVSAGSVAAETTAGPGETTVATVPQRRWPSNSVVNDGEGGEVGEVGAAEGFDFKHARHKAVVLYDFTALHDTGHNIVRWNVPGTLTGYFTNCSLFTFSLFTFSLFNILASLATSTASRSPGDERDRVGERPPIDPRAAQ